MTRTYRIVAALDGTAASNPVLEHTLDQAARHDAPEIHLIVVASAEHEIAALEHWLANAVAGVFASSEWRRPEWQTHTHVREGVADEEIANLAGELEADLIVIGRHAGAPGAALSDRVLRAAVCPTLVVGLDSTATAPCPVCAAVRDESAGACWYCAQHEHDSRTLLSIRVDPRTRS